MGRKKRRQGNLSQPPPVGPTPSAPRTPASSPPPHTLSSVRSELFSGPLPPPDVLEKYNRVLPGLAERIVALTENQSRHRQNLEKTVTAARLRSETLGQMFAFILALVALAGSFWLISLGYSTTGLAVILGEIAALVGAFVYGRRSQQKELSDKRQALVQRQ